MVKLRIAVILAAATCLAVPAAGSETFLISPLSFDFGNVAVGGTGMTQRVKVTNVTTSAQTLSLTGGGGGSFGGTQNCQGNTLAAGASCYVDYIFKPTALGGTTATTSLSVNGQNVSFSFAGNGTRAFRITPTSLDFGNVATGSTSAPQSATVTNISNASQTLSLTGGGGGLFGGTQDCQGNSLAPGSSCSVQYAFTPTSNGATTATTSLTVNGQNAIFSFSGIGGATNASPFLVSARGFDFGDVPVGEASAAQRVTVTNASAVAQTLSLTGGGGGLFGGTQDCQGNTLAPGASCHVDYAFTPDALGDKSGATSLSINGEQFNFSFAGTGVDPFLVTPLSFDFGEIAIGSTSLFQEADVFNVSGIARTLNLTGGGGGVFGGTQNCQANTLDPGDHCSIFYSFTPTIAGLITGTTSLTINGFSRTFSFKGFGVDSNPTSPTPEPATWISMMVGFGFVAGAMRYARRSRQPRSAMPDKLWDGLALRRYNPQNERAPSPRDGSSAAAIPGLRSYCAPVI